MALITPVNAAEQARNGHAVRKARSSKTSYNQAVHLQGLLMDRADLPEVKPIELSSVARVWVELEECKRKLKMKPLPKPIDVTKKSSSRKRPGPGFSEHPATTGSAPPQP